MEFFILGYISRDKTYAQEAVEVKRYNGSITAGASYCAPIIYESGD